MKLEHYKVSQQKHDLPKKLWVITGPGIETPVLETSSAKAHKIAELMDLAYQTGLGHDR
jgi:hypothetical protein